MTAQEGKTVIITGGSSGIGLAAAKRFVAEGAFVFVTGRRRPELDKAVKEIGRTAIAVMSGVSNLSDLDRLYKRHTYEDYVGQRGLERVGKHKWGRHVVDVVARLVAALEADDVALGGATWNGVRF